MKIVTLLINCLFVLAMLSILACYVYGQLKEPKKCRTGNPSFGYTLDPIKECEVPKDGK